MKDMTPIIIAAIPLGFALFKFFVPNFEGKKLDHAIKNISILVSAAQQLFPESKMGAKREAWVYEQLEKIGVKIDLTQAKAILESEVYKLKKGA